MADSQYARRGPSVAQIRQRLTGTAAPRDPLKVVMPPDLDRWPAQLRQRLAGKLVPAGVLIPIIQRPDALTVLFTRRSPHLKYHAGQVSFPGGRMEAGDADILATALRETREEIGIHPDSVQIAGFLAPLPTMTGYAVTAIVGLLPADIRIVADPTEVERVFEVPLGFLLDPANRRRGEREVAGTRVPVTEFLYAEERIWGATASILTMLDAVLTKTKVNK